MKIDLRGHASMFGANAIWGIMSPIAKFAMISGTITPLVVTNLRIAGAMILFWLVSLFMKPEQVGSKDLAKLFGASLLAIIFNQGCFITGLGMTSPTNASIITTSMPLWAMILAAFFLKEPITGKKIMGIAAGASGAVLLILGGSSAGGAVSSSIWGDLMVLTAQLSYALYIVLFKDFVSRYSIFTVMKWMFTFAFHWRLLKSVNAKLLNSVFMLVTRFSGLQTLSHFSNDYIGVGALKLGSPIFHECRTIHFQPDC